MFRMIETQKDHVRYRFSLTEMIIWTAAISILLALPTWLGDSAIQCGFYGTLALVTWRLSRVMPTILAAVIGVVLAIVASAIMVTWLQV